MCVEPLAPREDLEAGVLARDARLLRRNTRGGGLAAAALRRGVGVCDAALARLAVPVLDPRPHVLAVDVVVPPEAVRAQPVDERGLVLVQRVRRIVRDGLHELGLEFRPDA